MFQKTDLLEFMTRESKGLEFDSATQSKAVSFLNHQINPNCTIHQSHDLETLVEFFRNFFGQTKLAVVCLEIFNPGQCTTCDESCIGRLKHGTVRTDVIGVGVGNQCVLELANLAAQLEN